MLNGIEVWRLGRPLHDFKFMVFQPLSGLLAGVFWVTIFLEDDITGGFAIIIQSPLKFIPQDVAVEIRIHDSINFASQASPFPSHAAPHHNRTHHMTPPQKRREYI